PDDARIIQAAKLATKALGIEPNFRRGGCTNANMAIARRIPAVTLGRGGTESGTHTLAEWFDPAGVWVCEQKSILLLLALAGIEGELVPLGETL
ncbi:MAG: peptidase M20, partial [Sutterella sp.]|nr:peptidase M20 [Sutterella sp.]